jgi:hypothetical protein
VTALAVVALAVIAAGLFLRWACVPVIAAFDLGRKVGLVVGKRDSERAVCALIRQLAAERGEDIP